MHVQNATSIGSQREQERPPSVPQGAEQYWLQCHLNFWPVDCVAELASDDLSDPTCSAGS